MEWASCRQILDEAAAMGVKEVAFSGGEPLIWGHIQNAVEVASKNGMGVFLYTTGNVSNAQEAMDNLKNAGLSRAMFSLFGASADQHENVTGVRGSFEMTLSIASYCSNIGLDTEFHFVPLSHNYKSLYGIAGLARRMGVRRISVLRLVPQGRAEQQKNQQLSYSNNLELLEIIETLRTSGQDVRLGSPYNFLMLRDKPQCRSGIDRLTIGPDLRIFPCDAFKHISPENIGVGPEYSRIGKKHSLPECWAKSPYLGAVRKYLTTEFAAECKICEKLENCKSGCMAQKFYAHGELSKCPDPMCLSPHYDKLS
jgi:radical SAM protein with 4Fe4S-binding SPASM domain